MDSNQIQVLEKDLDDLQSGINNSITYKNQKDSVSQFVSLVKYGSFLVRIIDMT